MLLKALEKNNIQASIKNITASVKNIKTAIESGSKIVHISCHGSFTKNIAKDYYLLLESSSRIGLAELVTFNKIR